MPSEMTFETLTWEQEGPLVTLTLNRPDQANTMNLQFMKEILQAAIACEEDDSVRGLMITGNGQMFSAGGDISWFGRNPDNISALMKEGTNYLHGAIVRFVQMPKPVILAINGQAAGAGMSLTLIGDYSVCAASARFTAAYTAAGLTPDASITHFLPRMVGIRRAKELLITNRSLSATEALDWGLVNEVVEDDNVQEAARKVAQQLANGPTKAYGTVKSLLNQSSTNSLEAQLQLEADGIAANARGEDGQAGITAFLEKRPPVFKGC